MLIAEELFLLMRRDDGKPESAAMQRGYGIAAAIVTDLVLAERITLSDDKDPRMTVLLLDPTGHPGVEEKRMLGFVPTKYPVLDPEPERRIRERLRVVLQGGTPRPEDATLLAILQGLGVAPKVLDEERGTLGRKDLKRRITEVTSQVKAGEAVAKAIAAMNAAIMTAAILPAIAAGGSAS